MRQVKADQVKAKAEVKEEASSLLGLNSTLT
jgi:hypothetical protein